MRKVLAASICALVFVAGAYAQATAGLSAISCTVRDPSGSSVPDAKVAISNDANGVTRNLVTNEAGVFTAPALTPASGYKVTISATGFAGYEAKDIVLQVGQNLDLHVSLAVGQSSI